MLGLVFVYFVFFEYFFGLVWLSLVVELIPWKDSSPLVSISISISFSIVQTPTVRPRAHYILHYIMCYS